MAASASQADWRRIRCTNLFCKRIFSANVASFKDQRYRFCKTCKQFHSYKVLIQQVIFQKPIKDQIIQAAQDFSGPFVLASALGVSPPTIYRWIRYYFKMTVPEFMAIYVEKDRENQYQPVDFSEFHVKHARFAPFDWRSLGPGHERE